MSELRERLEKCAEMIDHLIEAQTEAHEQRMQTYERQGWATYPLWAALDSGGQPVLAPLLVAQANVLSALAHLEPK